MLLIKLILNQLQQICIEEIAKEKPDALLPTMGGQTALNCALDLDKHGVLKKYNVELIGASKKAIDKAEDRQQFKEAMNKIGLASARSLIAHSLEEAVQVQASIAILVTFAVLHYGWKWRRNRLQSRRIFRYL